MPDGIDEQIEELIHNATGDKSTPEQLKEIDEKVTKLAELLQSMDRKLDDLSGDSQRGAVVG